ncbi:magnesium and cobalt transport protein CorA [Nonomuraea sp. NBC_01738]|uniref:magnesium and cobalt transport protein CorA n=1 Tax=Nonomuraea sp. NBC_01738 TaxID=2976003 RepID=UPI002E106C55|nr:magnesium and cobalt transport protein CorA [Nonomuraea sp. NBC_01738]
MTFPAAVFRAWRCDADGVHPLDGDISITGVPDGTFVWIEADHPTHEQLKPAITALGLRPDQAHQVVSASQRPQQDTYDDVHVVVLRALGYTEATSSVLPGTLTVIVSGRVLLAVRACQDDPLTPARAMMERDGQLRAYGVWGGVYAIATQLAAGYAQVADELAKDVTELERKVFARGHNDVIDQIYFLIREVLECRNGIEPMSLAVDDLLARRGLPATRLRELSRHVRWAATSVRDSEYLLSSILTAQQGQITMWQNADMRKISAWAAVIAVPTLVSSVYGMNFAHMPELSWRFGYPVTVGIMALICWTLYRAFKRNGWL